MVLVMWLGVGSDRGLHDVACKCKPQEEEGHTFQDARGPRIPRCTWVMHTKVHLGHSYQGTLGPRIPRYT